MSPLDRAMYDLCRALCFNGRDEVISGMPWAPTREQIARLIECVNGRPATEIEIELAVDRYRAFMR